jgi:hypothetical protein
VLPDEEQRDRRGNRGQDAPLALVVHRVGDAAEGPPEEPVRYVRDEQYAGDRGSHDPG